MINSDFALLLLGGFIDEEQFQSSNRMEPKYCIAADSAAESAREFGLKLDAIIGDFDSISKDTLDYYRKQNHPCTIVHVPEQEHNDFEKALLYLVERWNGEVRIIGMTGGRMDHTLSNLSVMLRYSNRFKALTAFDTFGSHFFLTEKRTSSSVNCPIGATISLMPFGHATGIETTNLRYPLSKETLRLGEREGLSNEAIGSPVQIKIESGALLVSVRS